MYRFSMRLLKKRLKNVQCVYLFCLISIIRNELNVVQKKKKDHKFDAKRILSCSVSVLLRTESLLEPGDSLC